MLVIEIIRKGRPLFVRQMMVGDLDKTKCSFKFLSHNLPDDTFVNVKCTEDGEIDFRGKKGEYRIIVPDNERIMVDLETNCDPNFRIASQINNIEKDILNAMGIRL